MELFRSEAFLTLLGTFHKETIARLILKFIFLNKLRKFIQNTILCKLISAWTAEIW